jgi:hypothetical protein
VWNTDTLILVRDYPNKFTDLDWLPRIGGNLAVLPVRGSHHQIRTLIGRLAPANVIFYGTNSWNRQPDQWLERWEARFPDTEFWSTALHGGIVLRFSATGILIHPTIVKSLWQDPDL